MIRAVPTNQATPFATEIAGFCNKIGPARQRGKRDEADCDPIGSIRMLPNSFYGFDDTAVRKRIGKWHDASPESRLRIGKRNCAATNSASNRMAGQAVSCAVAAKATKHADPSATQPTKFDLIANCTIAKALGLEIP